MARINLMPWREQRRKQRHQAFMRVMGLSALAAVALVMVGWTFNASQVDAQQDRNKLLEDEIGLMKKKVKEIQDLDIKRERLLGRKQVIEELQSNRSQIVHLFDELIRSVPDGVQLTAIKQTGGFLIIEGRTESSSRVSDYMSRLESSPWLEKTDLQIIEEQGKEGAAKNAPVDADALPYFFRIKMNIVNPNQAKDENGEPLSVSPAQEAALPIPEVAPGAVAPSAPSPMVPPAVAPAELKEASRPTPAALQPSTAAPDSVESVPGVQPERPAALPPPQPETPSRGRVPGETNLSAVPGKVN